MARKTRWRVFLPTVFLQAIISMFACINECNSNEVDYTYANENKLVSLNCNFTGRADRMRWFFQENSVGKEVYVYDNKIRPYEGYVGNCSKSERYCNLLMNATMNKVGRYRFEFGDRGEDTIHVCTYELTIGNLNCTSNIRSNQVMVGKNDCPVKPDTIYRSCSFHHRGNIGPLRFVWLKKITEDTILRHKILTNVQEESHGNERISSVNDDFQVMNDMQGITFECSLEGYSLIAPCKLSPVTVQYVQTPDQHNLSLTNSDAFSNASCTLNKSESLECSYYWLLNQKDTEYKIQSQHLSKEHLALSGDYICKGSCQFVTGEKCTTSGIAISFTLNERNDEKAYYIVVITILCLLLLAVVALNVYFFVSRRDRSGSHKK